MIWKYHYQDLSRTFIAAGTALMVSVAGVPLAHATQDEGPGDEVVWVTVHDQNGNAEELTVLDTQLGVRFVNEEGEILPGGLFVLDDGEFLYSDDVPAGTIEEYPFGERSFKRSDRGGVEVPQNYIYNPRLGARHDYCTHSPDQFPSPGVNADFSGACARHDMCYDSADANDGSYKPCDDRLYSDMKTVCNKVYSGWRFARRNACNNTAWVYYKVVRRAHSGHKIETTPSNYNGLNKS